MQFFFTPGDCSPRKTVLASLTLCNHLTFPLGPDPPPTPWLLFLEARLPRTTCPDAFSGGPQLLSANHDVEGGTIGGERWGMCQNVWSKLQRPFRKFMHSVARFICDGIKNNNTKYHPNGEGGAAPQKCFKFEIDHTPNSNIHFEIGCPKPMQTKFQNKEND